MIFTKVQLQAIFIGVITLICHQGVSSLPLAVDGGRLIVTPETAPGSENVKYEDDPAKQKGAHAQNHESMNDVEVAPWDDGMFEGDIDLVGRPLKEIVDVIDAQRVDQNDSDRMSNAVADKLRLWPYGIIPYNLSTQFDNNQKAVIGDAMEEIQLLTCIRWVTRRPNEENFVNIILGSAQYPTCRSAIGRNMGVQEITLSPNCLSKGIVMHEMMHAIGFLHEQSRTDRDRFVDIQWQNVPYGKDNENFQTYGLDRIDSLGTNYDYSSILHYPRIINGIEIIVPRIDVPIGQRKQLSENDIYKINKLYKCLQDEFLIPVCDMAIDCVQRAQKGECKSNSSAMMSECQKYCFMCHKEIKQVSPDIESLDMDEDPRCAKWAEKGKCSTAEYFMQTVCARACAIQAFIDYRNSHFNTGSARVRRQHSSWKPKMETNIMPQYFSSGFIRNDINETV